MLTFFPMHILGLEGMPRRDYTYPGGLGWTGPNLIETLGSYILTAGLLLMVFNLVRSYRRGAVAGNDPWKAPTLEWSTTSPPPPYNYPVIPSVTSPYAMWDPQDREEDHRRLEQGVLTLERGHETQTTSTLDGNLDEVLEMPHDSPYPVLLAAALAGVFVMLLTGHWTTSIVFVALVAAAVAAWQREEPGAPTFVGSGRRSISNGIWGMGIFIASEATLFGTLIATYFYLQARAGVWPPKGIEAPAAVLPLVLTGVLLATTIPMLAAARAATRGRRGIAFGLVAAATAVQCGYLTWQVVLYLSDLDKFSPSGTAYGSIYFTLIGADHVHVFVGILFNLWVMSRLIKGLNNYRLITVRAVAFYWVFVNLLTVLVTLTQVSPS
jgi:cytochrome c oxidase subunit I+III